MNEADYVQIPAQPFLVDLVKETQAKEVKDVKVVKDEEKVK